MAKSILGTPFEILQLFERPEPARLSLPEVAARIGVSKGTASPLLAALADAGYLARLGAGGELQYVMGPRFQQAYFHGLAAARSGLLADLEATSAAILAALRPLEDLAGAMAASGDPPSTGPDGQMAQISQSGQSDPGAGPAAPEAGEMTDEQESLALDEDLKDLRPDA